MIFTHKNIEKMSSKDYLLNRDRIKLYFKRRNKRLQNKRKTENRQLSNNVRSRLSHALGRSNKKLHTTDLIGCSIEELKKYLESKFIEGMAWDNYGLYGWHIDHIKPCSKFDLSMPEEQAKCFHYSNLQPLWAVDNLKKSNIF